MSNQAGKSTLLTGRAVLLGAVMGVTVGLVVFYLRSMTLEMFQPEEFIGLCMLEPLTITLGVLGAVFFGDLIAKKREVRYSWVSEILGGILAPVIAILLIGLFGFFFSLVGEIQLSAEYDSALNWDGKQAMQGFDLSGRDLAEKNLSNADLRNAELREIILHKATLFEANMQNANLSKADLRGADLRGANLYEANLAGANLRGADLSGADMSYAYLVEANLIETNLSGTNLRMADLSSAKLTGATYTEGTRWPLFFNPIQAGMILFDDEEP